VNVGKYVHFQDQYNPWIYPANMPLSLDYYVLGYNRDNAMKHFKQVQRMMACFERFFGLYPFWEDGFKLVEAPYWGMEHQSCVAYGNEYKNNNYGFDFIIIHESAHEWFANSITANDPAEMWIHESFTTYAEAIFVECSSGKEKAVEYLIGQRTLIGNKEPMIGPRDEYFHDRADNDIYYKGSWMLHTLRHAVSNDSLFFGALLGFSNTFKHKVIGTNDVIDYFSKALNRNLRPFFTQYLYTTKIPTLEYKISRTSDGKLIMRYRWANTVKGLGMSIQVTATKNKWEVVTPRKRWQLIDLNYFDENEFKINTDHSLIITKRLK
jgi:aminopeptidase N